MDAFRYKNNLDLTFYTTRIIHNILNYNKETYGHLINEYKV